jgi:hypothetical protein
MHVVHDGLIYNPAPPALGFEGGEFSPTADAANARPLSQSDFRGGVWIAPLPDLNQNITSRLPSNNPWVIPALREFHNTYLQAYVLPPELEGVKQQVEQHAIERHLVLGGMTTQNRAAGLMTARWALRMIGEALPQQEADEHWQVARGLVSAYLTASVVDQSITEHAARDQAERDRQTEAVAAELHHQKERDIARRAEIKAATLARSPVALAQGPFLPPPVRRRGERHDAARKAPTDTTQQAERSEHR